MWPVYHEHANPAENQAPDTCSTQHLSLAQLSSRALHTEIRKLGRTPHEVPGLAVALCSNLGGAGVFSFRNTAEWILHSRINLLSFNATSVLPVDV